VRDTHNLWLQNLAELGAPGLLLIAVVAIAALAVAVAGRRRARGSLSAGVTTSFLAALIVFLLHASVDWMWQSTAVTVFALAGVAVIAARQGMQRPRLRAPARALLALLAAAAAFAQLPGVVSTAAIRRSQAAERDGDPALALAWAREAAAAEPWSASAFEQQGLVLEGEGALPEAAQDLERAISREPTNFRHWLVLARVEAERGDLKAALTDYVRAHQLRPLAAVFQLSPSFRIQGR
jgi:tetratricopeptide (TPR) repeat protein